MLPRAPRYNRRLVGRAGRDRQRHSLPARKRSRRDIKLKLKLYLRWPLRVREDDVVAADRAWPCRRPTGREWSVRRSVDQATRRRYSGGSGVNETEGTRLQSLEDRLLQFTRHFTVSLSGLLATTKTCRVTCVTGNVHGLLHIRVGYSLFACSKVSHFRINVKVIWRIGEYATPFVGLLVCLFINWYIYLCAG